MEYTELTDNHRSGLRRDRVLHLEGEYFRLELLVSESTNPDEAALLVAQQAELVRRIGLHLGTAAPDEIAESAATAEALEGATERP